MFIYSLVNRNNYHLNAYQRYEMYAYKAVDLLHISLKIESIKLVEMMGLNLVTVFSSLFVFNRIDYWLVLTIQSMQTLRIHHEHFHEWLNALQLVEIRGVRLFLFE